MRIDIKNTVTYISYNEEEGYQVTVLLETKNGLVPYEIKKVNFIDSYPLLAKKIKEGKILYLDSYNGYIGNEQTEGPHCEEQVFISEYEGNNSNFNELLVTMENNIKNKKTTPKKLIKVGPKYINYNQK
jgi:hypothetical protein